MFVLWNSAEVNYLRRNYINFCNYPDKVNAKSARSLESAAASTSRNATLNWITRAICETCITNISSQMDLSKIDWFNSTNYSLRAILWTRTRRICRLRETEITIKTYETFVPHSANGEICLVSEIHQSIWKIYLRRVCKIKSISKYEPRWQIEQVSRHKMQQHWSIRCMNMLLILLNVKAQHRLLTKLIQGYKCNKTPISRKNHFMK